MFKCVKNKRKGITLVEMLISVLILGVTLGAMLGAFLISRVGIREARHRIKAMNLLSAKMEWVKNKNYSTIESWIGSPIIENNVDDAVGTDELLDDTRTTSVIKDANGNLVVTVTLNWKKRKWGGFTAKGDLANPDEKIVTLISTPK